MSTGESLEVNGQRVAAEILSRLPRVTRSRLIEAIRVVNPSSAVAIESLITNVTLDKTRRELFQREVILDKSNETVGILASSNRNIAREPRAEILSAINDTHQHSSIARQMSRVDAVARDIEATGTKTTRSLDAAYPEKDEVSVMRPRLRIRLV